MSHTAILTAVPFYQYIGAGLPLFILLYIFYIFISIPSVISVSPSLHFPLHLFPYGSKQKVFKTGKRSKQFAASHMMIEISSTNFAFLAVTEIKDDSKIKR